MNLKIVNYNLRKSPQMVKNVKSEIVCRKVENGKGKMSLKGRKEGKGKTERGKRGRGLESLCAKYFADM